MNKIKLAQEVWDLIYPIGSVYFSKSEVNPSSFFGGTWERVKGLFPVGVDEDDEDFKFVFQIGGSKYIQDHQHGLALLHPGGTEVLPYGLNYTYNGVTPIGAFFKKNYMSGPVKSDGNDLQTGNSGNLPPYIALYIWVRIS